MLGFEDYRLDLRYWEIEKKEVSENGELETLHFRKRQRKEIEIVKDSLTESPKTYTAYGYEEIDGKVYVLSLIHISRLSTATWSPRPSGST